jgi:hypothetical protein
MEKQQPLLATMDRGDLKMKQATLAIAVSTVLGVTAIEPVSAIGLADGFYDMVINNTPYSTGFFDIGSDGAWNSNFTTGCAPGSKNCFSNALYDDTIAQPVNGKYSGVANDGVAGTIGIQVVGGAITGTGKFEFDTIDSAVGGDFAEYGGSSSFTGSIDAAGNISLTPTGALATFSGFPALVDERWNVDNFNGTTGTNFVVNPPNTTTTYDSFSTGSATNANGIINGAAYDGTTAILVKGGLFGSDWLGFFGVTYFETWNVSFNLCHAFIDGECFAGDPIGEVPIPAAVWLFGSGLVGLAGVARRKKHFSLTTHADKS